MEERRRNERFSLELAALVTGGDGRKQQQCKIVELSKDGIRLLLNEKVKFGEKIAIRVLLPGLHDPLVVPVTVRWNKQRYDDAGFDYLLGGELESVEPDEGNVLFDYMRKHGTPVE